jgi:asparagine synthase (glutamine-hydrolysing)
LGHARLSIIDIGGGAQPMTIEDGRYVVSFNGEIYNYKELRRNLIARGHHFSTESDTEVILHQYQEYGEDFLQEMNGMFAFAVWDAAEKALILARDRMGEKPLYYSRTRDGIVFASELKALHLCPDLDLTINTRALDDYLAYGYVPAPHTIYNEVSKLTQAHYLKWQDGEITIKPYWGVGNQERKTNADEAVEELDELLNESVRIRLRSDVPVGSFLSGGIDSTLITAAAQKQSKEALQSFTIGFESESHDESEDAEFTANFLGTRHTTKRVDGMSLGILPDLVRQYDEPFADPSTIPTYYVTREASKHLKVCLSGDAGDELFGGYPQYNWESLEQGISTIPAAVRRALLRLPAAVLPKYVRGYGWLERMMCDGANRYQQKIGVFNPNERRDLLRQPYRDQVDADAELLQRFFEGTGNEIRMRQCADLETYLPDDILVKVDRSSMAHSLEVRTPFLDHRLVEFAYSLPFDLKINNGEQKWLLRQLLKSTVPAEVLERRKRGFGMPLCDWFRGEYREFVAERLLQKSNRIFDYLEPQTVEFLVNWHNRGQRDFSDRIWTLIWLEEWLRAFGSDASRAAPATTPIAA